jgi:4-diphosphocytidyl-2-C-methyl-D-erythritol kinase
MLVFPHAKVNLGLHVTGLRADGYRDIETVMVPIPLFDALELIVDEGVPEGSLHFTRTGLDVPGATDTDLCVKAHGLLKTRHHLPGLRMHLHKTIPIGAGLGGGSSDGAHALRMINDLLALGELPSALSTMAASLGSDCAFFLCDGPQIARGRGELLSPVHISCGGLWLMLINPGIHVPTAEVYANTPIAPATEDLAAWVAHQPVETWSGHVVNVMQDYVMTAYPTVARAERRIRGAGALWTAMSGSGSSVLGLFRTRPELPVLPQGHRGWVFEL